MRAVRCSTRFASSGALGQARAAGVAGALPRGPSAASNAVCWRPAQPDARPLHEKSGLTVDLPPTIAEKDLHWEFFRATGPGGQHRNKTETGVRLTHLPSGVTVSATERRSQYQNREVALLRLAAALAEKNKPPPKPRRPTKPSRAAKRRRMDAKRRRGRTKALRRRPAGD